MKLILLTVAFFFASFCFAQKTYSSLDSAKAKSYFDYSWNYSIFSPKHQLCLDSALLIIPTYAYYWQQKAMPLYKAQKYFIAKPFLDSAVKYDRNKWLDYRAFMKCIFEKDYTSALNEFRICKAELGNKTVQDHAYDFYIGLCHLQMSNFDSSKFYFDKCIDDRLKMLGKNWDHHLHLLYQGISLMELGDYENAIKSFDKAIAIYTHFSDAKYYKAICLRRLLKTSEALQVAKEAKEDYDKQYTINEDNSIYENYPYQLRIFHASGLIKSIEEAIKNKN